MYQGYKSEPRVPKVETDLIGTRVWNFLGHIGVKPASYTRIYKKNIKQPF